MSGFEDEQKKLRLKIPEDEINKDNPWHDDMLERKQISKSLTNLVKNQKEPFVISLDGEWGTGKTFLLKRWNQELQNKNFNSIYFNTWEDDFCDDPFVAIIGQISNYLKKNSYGEKLEQIKKSLPKVALEVLNNMTGIDLKGIADIISDKTFEQYSLQREKKDELNECLREMSKELAKENPGSPLVFIIDELDRCRPNFAIELLEKVKHIFDIPNMVFVLGMNRKQLSLSIKSAYGEIDADVYLRRFFDMSLILPEPDSKKFCEYLIEKYKLPEVFKLHGNDFDNFRKYFPTFCSGFKLSLRDIDYCIRSMVFVAKNIQEREYLYPYLVGPLVLLHLDNPDLYRKFIQGEILASKVVDCFDEKMVSSGNDNDANYRMRLFLLIEANLYLTNSTDFETNNIPLEQLKLLSKHQELDQPEYLSTITQRQPVDVSRVEGIIQQIYGYMEQPNGKPSREALSYISELIDLSETVKA